MKITQSNLLLYEVQQSESCFLVVCFYYSHGNIPDISDFF